MRAESDTVLQNQFIYVTGKYGEAGSTAELTFNMHNTNPICSWACDLYLPEGVIFKSVSLINDRWPEGYEAQASTIFNDNGSVTIYCNGSEDIGLNGNDGPVATITVDIADTVTSGKYLVTVADIRLVSSDGRMLWKDYTELRWTIMGGNISFAEEGKVWNMQYYDISGSSPDYKFNYFIKGDTLIAGLDCKKLYSFNEDNDNKVKYQMALRESEGKVYFILNGSTESYLLYDFLIPVGTTVVIADDIHPDWKREMKNKEDRLIDINGVSRHCLFVNRVDAPGGDCPSGWWIEGIGSELGPLNTWCFEGGGYTRFFLSCEVNGRVIFNRYNFKLKLMESDEEIIPKYFPEGTKWTEIRLDTLKYDSWYSKVGNEWVPNYETIEYSCGEKHISRYYSQDNYSYYLYIDTNSPDWPDYPAFLIYEHRTEKETNISAAVPSYDAKYFVPGNVYQFNWTVGRRLYYQEMIGVDDMPLPDMIGEDITVPYTNDEPEMPIGIIHDFGTIEEIKEGDFGGIRPLKYVDLNGIRIIYGIGVTEWNDGECLFGPANLYKNSFCFKGTSPERHYRSMLVHFERDGEVLYDVWPAKETTGIETMVNQVTPNNSYFDLQGRRLAGKPSRGIYIEGGKKWIRE